MKKKTKKLKKKFLLKNLDKENIWECNFEKDDCGLKNDLPSDLNVFKFIRGNKHFKDFKGENGTLYFYIF